MAEFYPEYKNSGLFSETATLYGLAEEAYRRLATLYRTSENMFPYSHNLLLAFFGNQFFEEPLECIYNNFASDFHDKHTIEILEPLNGYIVGPILLRQIRKHQTNNSWWIRSTMEYEWAVWHARRVAIGWPPVTHYPPLANGASLVSAECDLKSLLTEIKRLERSTVSSDIFLWRISPGPGYYYAAIFPKNGDVMEAKMNK